jgi:diguanylate cyclase (GGDEF)-like protein
LTGLKNRLAFQEDLKEIVPLLIREKMNAGVLLINIDRFRAVNDEHGNEFGDQFLKLYAQTIKDSIRSSDIAVRYGGGEFLVVLVHVVDEQKVIEIAEHIKENLAQTSLLTQNNDEFKKTVCIGVSMFPQDSMDMNDIVQKAEIALSDAKDLGRSQVVRYEDSAGELDLF